MKKRQDRISQGGYQEAMGNPEEAQMGDTGLDLQTWGMWNPVPGLPKHAGDYENQFLVECHHN